MNESQANPSLDPTSPFSEVNPSKAAADDIRQAADSAGATAKNIASDANAKAQQLKQSAVEKAQKLREFAGSKATDLKANAGVKAQKLKEVAGQQVQQGKVKAREVHTTAEDYIRENPTKSVLTALGVGVVLGIIIRR